MITASQYRAEVDGLRAIAVMPVMFFHAGFEGFSGGFVGVDVFFVISGYLITQIIASQIQVGHFSLIQFYERRARRILPALVAMIAVTSFFAWHWLMPNDMHSYAQSVAYTGLFSSNVFFWQTSGYFETAAELKPLLHTWSLAVEEQFYLFFPLLMLGLWRLGRTSLLLVAAALLIVSLGLAQWLTVAAPMASFYLAPTRAWELLIGSLIALVGVPQVAARFNQFTLNALCTAGLGLIMYAVAAFDRHTPFPSVYALAPTIGTALLLLFASPRTLIGQLLSHRWLVGVGLISYSLYLWHQPLLALARYKLHEQISLDMALALLALTFVLAYVSWRFVEQPFRDNTRVSRNQIFAFSALSLSVLIAFGLAGHLTRGFENRAQFASAWPGDVGHHAFHQHLRDAFHPCSPAAMAQTAPTWDGQTRCYQTQANIAVQIALIGDSHAEHLFPGLAQQLPSKNVALYIQNSHPFISNPLFKPIFNHVMRTPSINTVILTMSWTGRVGKIGQDKSLYEQLQETINGLQAAGKKVYLLDDVPVFRTDAQYCKYGFGPQQHQSCSRPTSEVTQYEAHYLPALQRLSQTNPAISYLPLRDLLCDERNCSMVKNGSLMYRDTNHLNLIGSQYVATHIVAAFPELKR